MLRMFAYSMVSRDTAAAPPAHRIPRDTANMYTDLANTIVRDAISEGCFNALRS